VDNGLESYSDQNGKSPSQLLDTTLRDGSYAVDFQLEPNFVRGLLHDIDACGLDYVEIGHGIGAEAERAGHTACNIELAEWSRLANEELIQTPWGIFAQPSFTRLSTLKWMCQEGMGFVRIGMEAHKIAANLDYLETALSHCKTVFLAIMKTNNTPKPQLENIVRKVPREISGIYVVDSCGTMLPADVRSYIDIFSADFGTVGFHGHDNLGLANANSLEAIAAGARIIDGSLHGIGRGGGNAATELLAGILTKLEFGKHDFRTLSKLAEHCRDSMDVIQNDRLMQVMGGVVGVHSSLFPAVDKISEKYMVDSMELMKCASKLAMYELKEHDLYAAATKILETNCNHKSIMVNI